MTHVNKKSFLIIGQAQGEKWKHGPMYASKLWDWFATIGLTREQAYEIFHFDALINTGTQRAKKGRVPPSGEQMKLYRPTLLENTEKLKPRLVIPVGGLAVQQVLDTKMELADTVGKMFTAKPFGILPETTIIPLPHPSGVSLWLNAASNRALLADTMQLIKQEID